MRNTPRADGPDLLGWWIQDKDHHRRLRPTRHDPTSCVVGIRFAFYGRMSTEDFQDPVSSERWQLDCAQEFIAGHGTIVARFFDVGHSRVHAWGHRPQAAAILAALANPDRGWDAIVVGEFERAFYGDQLERMAPVIAAHGVQIWLPELGGPFDPANQFHLPLLKMLAVHSKREVQRARHRVKASMRAQVTVQGRNLGGRPPYGYRLIDAGPHPNKAHARWGRRAQRLDPDPKTAPHVQWMFAQRLAGWSVTAIARDLNERAIPCPSQTDPDRNPHRTGQSWIWQTVAAILANPRYTGRPVWNRQHSEIGPLDGTDDLLGQSETRQWNALTDWVISDEIAHPPLVNEADFIAAQDVHARPTPANGAARVFLFTGLLFCHLCLRALDAHWVHDHAGYRCRHGHTSTRIPGQDRARNIYVRQDRVLLFLAEHVSQLNYPLPHDDAALDMIAHRLTAFRQNNDMIIICDRYTWRLEINGEAVFEGWPPHLPRTKPQRPSAETPPLNRAAQLRSVGKYCVRHPSVRVSHAADNALSLLALSSQKGC